MRAFLLVFLGLVCSVSSDAQTPTWLVIDDPTHPQGQLRYDSGGGLPCDGQTRPIPAYAFPSPVTITEVCLWQGSNDGTPFPAVDLYAGLFASRPWGYVLHDRPEDRYSKPGEKLQKSCRTMAHELTAGEMVGGGFFCQALSTPSATHVAVTVYYRRK